MFYFIGSPKQIHNLSTVKPISPAVLKQKIIIAVIDDVGLSQSLKDKLQSLGYQLRYFNDITNLETVSSFDVILCDIRGVGRSFNETYEGAFVIKELRKQYPTKFLVAFTGSDIDRNYNKFILSADVFLEKDASSDKWVEILDIALSSQADPVMQWRRFSKYLVDKGVDTLTILKIEDEFVSSILYKHQFPSHRLVDNISSKEIVAAIKALTTLVLLLSGGN